MFASHAMYVIPVPIKDVSEAVRNATRTTALRGSYAKLIAGQQFPTLKVASEPLTVASTQNKATLGAKSQAV